MESRVLIDLDRLLWRSRGSSWDYEDLLLPRRPWLFYPYTLHREVFGQVQAGHEPVLRIGSLRAPGAKAPLEFSAALLLDPERRDVQGRNVAHSFLWFHAEDERTNAGSGIPRAWPLELLQWLAPVLNADGVFDGADAPDREAMDRKLRQLGRILEVSGEAAASEDVRPVGNFDNIPRISNGLKRRIEQAIDSEVAAACGLRGRTIPLRSLLSRLRKHRSDPESLVGRLCAQFGGQANDLLIRRVLEEAPQRVVNWWYRYQSSSPKSDLVEALNACIQAETKDEAVAWTAALIKGSPDDVAVRKLAHDVMARRSSGDSSGLVSSVPSQP